MHPQRRLFIAQIFLDFCEILFPEWPLNFLVHDSPSIMPSPAAGALRGYSEGTGTRPDYLVNRVPKN